MKNVLLGLTALLALPSVAQKISGKFSKTKPKAGIVHLGVYEGHVIKDLEEAKVDSEGNFVFENKKRPYGLYALYGGTKKRKVDLILNKEDDLFFTFNNNTFTSYSVDNSLENAILFKYKTEQRKLKRSVGPFRNKLKNRALPSERRAGINDTINMMEKSFFEGTNQLINKHPNTFFSTMILAGDPAKKVSQKDYFNDIDFTDDRLTRTPVLSKRYTDYIIKFGKGQKYTLMDCVDNIMEKAKANQTVYEFSAYSLLEGFYNSGYQEISDYILSEYIFGEDCGGFNVSDVLKQRSNGIKRLSVGNIALDITAKNDKFKDISLKDIANKNKYTLLMFWSSTCHHCEQQMPMMSEVYKKYNPEGFEIYSVSLDNNSNNWKKALQKNNMNWINTCDFLGWDSPITETYKIIRTPSFFLVDKNMKIVSKPLHVKQVEPLLKELYNYQKK
jgi:thiol-disulfide isomerase/thioredoxin